MGKGGSEHGKVQGPPGEEEVKPPCHDGCSSALRKRNQGEKAGGRLPFLPFGES